MAILSKALRGAMTEVRWVAPLCCRVGVTQLMKKLIAVSLALVLAGCVQTARLYNLDSGEILTAKYTSRGTGHGTVTLTKPNGKVLTGEYTTIDTSSFSSGMGTASVFSGGQYAWATGQGFSFTSSGSQYGSAVCVGDGEVIEVLYQVSIWSGHGNGVGKDNKGGKYRLQF